MPLKRPDLSQRADLTELMDLPCSRAMLRACLRDLAWTNRWTLAARPLLRWLDSVTSTAHGLPCPLRILDAGSGYGDGLRQVERWAMARGIEVELHGLDLNPDATAIAAEASGSGSRIRWVTADVLGYEPVEPIHLVMSSLFTHHLSNEQIVAFVRWMEEHAQLGWFINDLARGAIPYHFFAAFSKLARLHPFVQHDGPISILRSFVAEDWQALCAGAGLHDNEFSILKFRPARLCVERRKTQ